MVILMTVNAWLPIIKATGLIETYVIEQSEVLKLGIQTAINWNIWQINSTILIQGVKEQKPKPYFSITAYE